MRQERSHWIFVWIPLVGAFFWFGTLLSLLITWLAQGRPIYVSMEGKIAYISDVGADFLKPLFIVGGIITADCFFLSLAVERWLKHSGRLRPSMRKRERVFSTLAIIGALMGTTGLVFLTIFDTKRHVHTHRRLLLVFMMGVSLSAIFTCIEYWWISKNYVEVSRLKKAYIAKAAIAGTLIALSIAFCSCLYVKKLDAGAVLEWSISFGFTLYLLTFYYDLRLAKGTVKGQFTSGGASGGLATYPSSPDEEKSNQEDA